MDEQLQHIYDALYAELKVYEKKPIVARVDTPQRYDLWSEVPVVLHGKQRPEMYFGSVLIQSSYVGFYFMPVYTHQEAKELFHPKLLKLLKGKSCFHIKSADEATIAYVRDALKIGYALYKKRGWV